MPAGRRSRRASGGGGRPAWAGPSWRAGSPWARSWCWPEATPAWGRPGLAGLGESELAGRVTLGAVMVLAWGYAGLVAAGRMGPHATRPLRDRPTRAAVLGLAVLGTVGLVANDSSVAVPLTMLIVV